MALFESYYNRNYAPPPKPINIQKVFVHRLCHTCPYNASFQLDFSYISLKVGSRNMAFTPSTLSSPKLSWQMTWHGLQVELYKPQAPTLPSILDMRQECRTLRQECRTFQSVASRPCDWLLFSLSYEDTRSFIDTKMDGKMDE